MSYLPDRIRLAVVFGGNKENSGAVLHQAQNTRSWKSYEAVAEDIAASLRRSGFRYVELMPDDMTLIDRLRRSKIDIAWLNSGGVQGHNSAAHAAAMLEMLGIPYVGHDSLSATTLDNKHAFKRGIVCAGLPTAPFVTWHMGRGHFDPHRNSRFLNAFEEYPGPFVVKPVSGRASLHVHVVPDRASLPEAIEAIYKITGDLVLVEKFLNGREFCISVAGAILSRRGTVFRNGGPFAFGALERVLSPGELIFTSMDTRPISGERFKEVDPDVECQLWQDMHRIARDVFYEFNLGSLIRLDLRADESGKLHILEANPKPDLKYPEVGVTSLVFAGLAQTNLDYDDLIASMFVNRLDFLLRHRRDSIGHIVDLIDREDADLFEFSAEHTMLDQHADTMVHLLSVARARMVG
jgi:D-alanine-D-alanine ligase